MEAPNECRGLHGQMVQPIKLRLGLLNVQIHWQLVSRRPYFSRLAQSKLGLDQIPASCSCSPIIKRKSEFVSVICGAKSSMSEDVNRFALD